MRAVIVGQWNFRLLSGLPDEAGGARVQKHPSKSPERHGCLRHLLLKSVFVSSVTFCEMLVCPVGGTNIAPCEARVLP
jgi:hypothetical protein